MSFAFSVSEVKQER